MTVATYALICSGLTVALLIAMLAPAPARPVDTEAPISPALLCAAVVAVLAMGAFALSDHHVAAVLCGLAASLIVVPCLWLARAPDGWEEWADEDDGDDGGSPRPSSPFTPPAPDADLPGVDPSGPWSARGAPASAPALTFAPTTAQAPLPDWALRQENPAWATAAAPEFVAPVADLIEQLPIDEPAWEPAPLTAPPCDDDPPALRQPLLVRRPAARVRGEHRSVQHLRAGGAHDARRRRPDRLRRRIAQACRRMLGVQTPDCRRAALEHGGRRHARRVGTRAGARRDTVSR